MTTTNPPFAPGSVSLRLYPHNELDAEGVLREILTQARLGLESGFDGIMTSEHHGGFAGYLPNPLQISGFILEDNPAGWAAPCPLLLPLRATAEVAEEIAWLDVRHPGRIGIGVGSGALRLDFDAMDVPLEEASARFKVGVAKLTAMLRGEDLGELAGDRALQRCATHPITVLSAAVSPAASRRSAAVGTGILLEGMSSTERLTKLCSAFTEAGGTGPKVLIRRVWLGEPDRELIARQRAVYESVGRDRDAAAPSRAASTFGPDQTVACADPLEMAQRLHEVLQVSGCDAINLRLHLPDIPAVAIRDQIPRIGAEVVPALRKLIAPGGTVGAAGTVG